MFKYQIDYAKSSRSECKSCKKKILSNELRIAYVFKTKGFFQPRWNHERCFFKNGKRFAHFSEFENFNTLQPQDQIRIKENLVDPNEQNSNCENDERKIVLDDREKAILSEFSIEKSKTSTASCRICGLRIIKDDLRIAKVEYSVRYGETPQFHHLSCFSNIRSDFKFSVGGEYMPGFELLSEADKENVKDYIRPHVQKPTMKHKIVPEQNTLRRGNDEEIRLQNETFHKHKRALRALSKNELENLCQRNDTKFLKGTEELLNLLADCMTFGVLHRCPECLGQLQLRTSNYECTGHRDEWGSCKYQTRKPRRKLMEIPLELLKYAAFGDYVPTLGERIFNERLIEIPPQQPKKPRTILVHAPLKNVQFYIHGLKAELKEAIKRRILRLGGLVTSQLVQTVAAVLSTPDALNKGSSVVEKIEIGGIHVIEEKYLDEIESTPSMEIIGALSLIEKHNIADWAFDVLSRVPQDVIEGKQVKVSGNMYSAKTADTDIATTKVKDGVPVLCIQGLEQVAHVYRDDEPFTATLNRTDLNSKFCANLSCTIQLLEADYSKRYWVVKRTGETGSKPFLTVKEFEDDLSGAKELFTKEFFKKTGNTWCSRHQFQKKHGKYDLVQLANLNKTIPVLLMDSQSSLPVTLQKLMVLLFDINIINKTIADIDVDSSKMPLGVLADEQIRAGYETLLHLFLLVQKGKVSYNRIKDLSNKFYTKIPHKGTEKDLVVLSSMELINSKFEMLFNLRNTHLSYKLLEEEMDASVNRMETYYHRLNTEIVTLDRDSKEFNIILEYFTNTQSERHLNTFKMHIEEIFLVEREGEKERYEPYKSLHNRKLLWHGSRLSNIAAILHKGLRIAPPGVPVTGYMFGKGIYFADVVTKSAQYIHATADHSSGVLLLCEVALGNMKKCYTKEYVTKLPDDTQSVWGVGRFQPDPSRAISLQDGTIVPLGNIVTNDDVSSAQGELVHNEFIVYDEAQVTIKYLLQLTFDVCT
ncbi:unnamed protein product [Colias eurytheme]|nr:unnamed protein product [Colias eurytheme]